MTQQNVERVREAYAAFNRGDADAAAAALHPDVAWHAYLGALEADVYRGREALLKLWSGVAESFGGRLRMEPRELIDRGEQIVAVVEVGGTGTGSGAAVRQTWAQLITMRDGLIFRVEPFADRDAAMNAAGASE